MASAAQVAANKENAQRPRTLTEETKASLQTRAVKHGLTAKLYTNTVLQGEDQAAYDQMLKSLLAEATLGTTQEAMLIQVLAQTFWKMQRASNIEAGALNAGLMAAQIQLKLPENPKNDNELGERLAFVLWEYADKLDKVRRYANAAERGFFRATKELAQLRKAGPQEQVGQQIGYVSQNAETPAEPAEEHKPEARDITTPEPENILQTLSNMNEKEAFALLDELTAPPQSK
jgi:hypothetical protein